MKREKESRSKDRPLQGKSRRDAGRCEYLSETGRRCRLPAVSAGSGLCATHERKKQADVTKLADKLEKYADSFHTPQGVGDVMFVLFFALVEGQISERKAGILTYMLQTTLHAQRAIERKEELEKKAEPLVRPIICDLPGPIRDDEPVKKAKPDLTTENTETTEKKTEAGKDTADAPGAEGKVGSESEGKPPAEEEKNTVLNTGHNTNPPPADLNHFFPVDPALPAHLQDPNRAPALPPSQAEIDRRNRQFDRTHGIMRRGKQSHPAREAPDWKILNRR